VKLFNIKLVFTVIQCLKHPWKCTCKL